MKRGFSRVKPVNNPVFNEACQNRGPDEEGIFTQHHRNQKHNWMGSQNRGPDEEGIFT